MTDKYVIAQVLRFHDNGKVEVLDGFKDLKKGDVFARIDTFKATSDAYLQDEIYAVEADPVDGYDVVLKIKGN